MQELNEQQKQAFAKLLRVLQAKGKRYVYTQGDNIEWFTVNEIKEHPFYEIKYLHEGLITVKHHKYENGFTEFVLKFNDRICEEKIISQETNSCFFADEFKVSSFVMECLNEMSSMKKIGYGYVKIMDDGSPLSAFRKNFMVG